MSDSQALTIATVAAFALLALAWQILRAWSGDRHDVGPDTVREQQQEDQ